MRSLGVAVNGRKLFVLEFIFIELTCGRKQCSLAGHVHLSPHVSKTMLFDIRRTWIRTWVCPATITETGRSLGAADLSEVVDCTADLIASFLSRRSMLAEGSQLWRHSVAAECRSAFPAPG